MKKSIALIAGVLLFLSACLNSTKNIEVVEDSNNIGDSTKSEYLKEGKVMALQLKKALGGNLMKAIESRGTAGAVEFCNSKAIAISDSISNVLSATIRRISDKPRNPKNTADKAGVEAIRQWKQDLNKGKELKPLFNQMGSKISTYYPIVTNAMCLQCHGSEKVAIQAETLAKIKALYPEDQATGYKENQVRGAFVVESTP